MPQNKNELLRRAIGALRLARQHIAASDATDISIEIELDEVAEALEATNLNLLDYNEAAALLGISKSTLRRLVDEGEIQAHQVAGRGPLKFHRADVLALVQPARGQAASIEITEIDADAPEALQRLKSVLALAQTTHDKKEADDVTP